MTTAEQDETLGGLIREYKAVGESIACLSSGIRESARELTCVDQMLYDVDQESPLAGALRNLDEEAIVILPERLADLRNALRRKEDLQTRLINMGYREFVQR